jgi:hypothetical protein
MFNFVIVIYVLLGVFCVLFLCKCELYCCHRVSTQLQLKIYIYIYHIISYHIIPLLHLCSFVACYRVTFTFTFYRSAICEAILDLDGFIVGSSLLKTEQPKKPNP